MPESWFDRNAKSIVDYVMMTGLAGAQATQSKIKYTVPSGRMAMVEVLGSTVARTATASPVGRPRAYWKITPKTAAAKIVLEASIVSNTVGDSDRDCLKAPMILLDGDEIEGFLQDVGTGGRVDYTFSYKLTEFTMYDIPEERKEQLDIQEPRKPWWPWGWPF